MSPNVRISENHSPFCSLPDCLVPLLFVVHLKCSTKIRNLCDTCKEIAENPEKKLLKSQENFGRMACRLCLCCVQTLDGCCAEFRAMACRLWTHGMQTLFGAQADCQKNARRGGAPILCRSACRSGILVL